MEKIGLKLKAARVGRGFTQKDFARQYGCTPQAIRNIEAASDLSTKTIRKYLACLGLRFEVVFV